MALNSAAACLFIDLGPSVGDAILGLAIFAIPLVAIPIIARLAKRHPSQLLLTEGRQAGGVRLFRCGLIFFAVSVVAILIALAPGWLNPTTCDDDNVALLISGIVGAFLSALMVGGGWAWAIRGTWVVLATIAVLDIVIFYVNVLIATEDTSPIRSLLLLAFIIHGICISLASSWSFRARNLGRIGRAKAGEAGRSLAAVWVFLSSYTGLTLIRSDNGIFDSAAGSAVIGALSLGALAVTMGSGFTKYAEAIYSDAPRAPAAVVGTAAASGTAASSNTAKSDTAAPSDTAASDTASDLEGQDSSDAGSA